MDNKQSWGVEYIRASSFWSRSRGQGQIVAVLDTGIDKQHPLFAGRLLPGYNAIFGQDPDDYSDNSGHGTHVAGIVAQVAPDSKILPVKVISTTGQAGVVALVRGLQFAVANGATVINISAALPAGDTVLHNTIKAATEEGVTIVAAAGNDGIERTCYPAAFPEVISVSNIDKQGNLNPWSNRGNQVDIHAPGTDIISAAVGGGYTVKSGTSQASPHVAGAVALVKSVGEDIRSYVYPDKTLDLSLPTDLSEWAMEARRWAVKENITDGTRPKDNVTREELWTMLYRSK